jgi:tRNA1Val (adenine37-N6)-methyltransferase
MPNSWFQFKQFTIKQDKCAMKVGTDSILLGAWASFNEAKNILDIGTGTGILSLMLAQRCNANITGIDIDHESIQQAIENINNSSWKNRIHLCHSSLQEYTPSVEKFDMIISNPPFFQNSLKTPDEQRTNARHNHSLNPEDIIQFAKKWLSSKGHLSIIWPVEQGEEFIKNASDHQIYCNRVTKIKPNSIKPCHRLLLEFSFQNKSLEESELVIENGTRHNYTEEYKDLTKDYYLHFKY